MDLTQCNLSLDIQELVLVDIPVPDPTALKQAVTAELTRLFEVQGAPSALAHATRQHTVAAGRLEISASDQLGIEIAQAIYRGLGK